MNIDDAKEWIEVADNDFDSINAVKKIRDFKPIKYLAAEQRGISFSRGIGLGFNTGY